MIQSPRWQENTFHLRNQHLRRYSPLAIVVEILWLPARVLLFSPSYDAIELQLHRKLHEHDLAQSRALKYLYKIRMSIEYIFELCVHGILVMVLPRSP